MHHVSRHDAAAAGLYTLSLHDALPISPPSTTRRVPRRCSPTSPASASSIPHRRAAPTGCCWRPRSEEHTSELQSQSNLVCRLLLEKKNLDPPAVGAPETARTFTDGPER